MRNLSSMTHLFLPPTLSLICFLMWKDISCTFSRSRCTGKGTITYDILCWFSYSSFCYLLYVFCLFMPVDLLTLHSNSQVFLSLKDSAVPVNSSVFLYVLPCMCQHLFYQSYYSKLPDFQAIWNSSMPPLSFAGLQKFCICKFTATFWLLK